MPQAAQEDIQLIRQQLQDACDYVEKHRNQGNTEGAWFHYGCALGFHEALISLGASDGSDFPGVGPETLVQEAPEEERGMRLNLIFEAIGDMDFRDDLSDDLIEELDRYLQGRQ